jgi:hypothetical protein
MGYLVTYYRQILDAVAHKLESLYVHPAELYWKCLQVVTGKTKATQTVKAARLSSLPRGMENLAAKAVRVFVVWWWFVHSVQQKSSGLKFRKSRSGSDMPYSCDHNLSRFTFPIFVHFWHFCTFHSFQSITPCIYSPKPPIHSLVKTWIKCH